MKGAVAKAQEILDATPSAFMLQQVRANPPETHWGGEGGRKWEGVAAARPPLSSIPPARPDPKKTEPKQQA